MRREVSTRFDVRMPDRIPGEAEARVELEQLEREAREKGFRFIADQARSVLLRREPTR